MRPESYKLDWIGSSGSPIRILSEVLPTDNAWRARKDVVLPLRSHCLCCLKRERDEKGSPTLGIFRPRSIQRLVIEEDSPDWSKDELAILHSAQGDLFSGSAPQQPQLEKLPFKFFYEFTCDESACTGHRLSCSDWEIGQSWRAWKDRYGDKWEEKLRLKYEAEMIEKRDTHFYVGTVHQHPAAWIIVGLFYPPRSAQGQLFAEDS